MKQKINLNNVSASLSQLVATLGGALQDPKSYCPHIRLKRDTAMNVVGVESAYDIKKMNGKEVEVVKTFNIFGQMVTVPGAIYVCQECGSEFWAPKANIDMKGVLESFRSIAQLNSVVNNLTIDMRAKIDPMTVPAKLAQFVGPALLNIFEVNDTKKVSLALNRISDDAVQLIFDTLAKGDVAIGDEPIDPAAIGLGTGIQKETSIVNGIAFPQTPDAAIKGATGIYADTIFSTQSMGAAPAGGTAPAAAPTVKK